MGNEMTMHDFEPAVPKINWDGINMTDLKKEILADQERMSLSDVHFVLFDDDEELMDLFIANNGIEIAENSSMYMSLWATYWILKAFSIIKLSDQVTEIARFLSSVREREAASPGILNSIMGVLFVSFPISIIIVMCLMMYNTFFKY
jgi:hypothetical protein